MQQPSHRSNNFDSIRLLAACMVFASHAFVLYGKHEMRLFSSPAFSGITLGNMGVTIFFAISGYLITQSWMHMKEMMPFLRKRFLRIYPALFLNIAVTVFLIAPLATTLGISAYMQAVTPMLPTLMVDAWGFHVPNLPGVFTTNPIPYSVNTPLWTLIFEMLCYLIICAAGMLLDLKKIIPVLTVVYVAVFFYKIFFPVFDSDLGLLHCATFLLGSCFYLYGNRLTYPHLLAFLSLMGLVWLILANVYFLPLYMLCVTYLTLYIALKAPHAGNAAKYGDFSYGLYIYSWPIQQSFAWFFHFDGAFFPVYFITSFLVTFMLAVFSWHVVEKNALTLKYQRIK